MRRSWNERIIAACIIATIVSIVGAAVGVEAGTTLFAFIHYVIPFTVLIACCSVLLFNQTVWRWAGVGLLCWTVADGLFFTLLDRPTEIPNPADFGYACLYIGLFVSLYGWSRRRYPALTWKIALEGLLVATTAGALVAAIALPNLIAGVQQANGRMAFLLLYPVIDMMLLMFVTLLLSREGWVAERTLLLLGGAILCFTITDVSFSITSLNTTLNGGAATTWSALDLGRMIGAIMLAAMIIQPVTQPSTRQQKAGTAITLPTFCALVSLVLLAAARFFTLPLVSWLLATGTILFVVIRLVTAYFEREEAYQQRTHQEQLLRDLLADMSHELRTPLTNMMGQMEAIYQPGTEHAGEVSSALRSAARMEQLINELLLLTRAQSHNLLQHQRINVAELCRTAVDETELLGVAHPLKLELEPVFVDGDAQALERAVINLLTNAYRHTAPGTNVSITTFATATHSMIRVCDEGDGVPLALQATMWERYVKGEHPESSGLGLALVQSIVQAMGGNAQLEDAPGCSVLLTLPRANDPADFQESQPPLVD